MPNDNFFARQVADLKSGGPGVVRRKLRSLERRAQAFARLLPGVPIVIVVRLLRPIVVVRFQPLISDNVGHLAGNTEMYLCERELGIGLPPKPVRDILYFTHHEVANAVLAAMWRRQLWIWPRWLAAPAHELSRRMPGADVHEAGSLIRNHRDVNNLLDRRPCHLSFSAEEHERGRAGLRSLGVGDDVKFVCIVGRDSAYLEQARPSGNFDYHSYRDAEIANFVEAAEMLSARGYCVIRMGSIVKERIPSNDPMVIDYATSELRTEFLDVYLMANCFFCLTVGSGLDSIALIFGRPLAYVNIAPICNYPTVTRDALFLGKRHRLVAENRLLSLTEIFANGSAFCLTTDCYAEHGVELVENTPHEIACVALEMDERLRGTWVPGPRDEELQRKFWALYPLDTREASEGTPLHGKVVARHSAHFLRENEEWLQ